MANYTHTTWTDRLTQYQNRFTVTDNGDGTETLVPYEGTITQAGQAITVANLNNIDDCLNSLRKSPTAGGTSTVITLSSYQFSLTDGAKISFVCAADNSGASTTLNVNSLGAKNVYKEGTTSDSPNLIQDKVYNAWYDSTDDCFYVVSKGEGTILTGAVSPAATNFTISSIPSGYDEYELILSYSTDANSASMNLVVNADTGSNYAYSNMIFNGTRTSFFGSLISIASYCQANDEAQLHMKIKPADDSDFMTFSHESFGVSPTTQYFNYGLARWDSSNALSSLQFTSAAGNFKTTTDWKLICRNY